MVLGEQCVGKSAFIMRIMTNTFWEDCDPTIEDEYRKPTNIDDKKVILDILDSAEWDDFAEHCFKQSTYYMKPRIFLLSFAINSNHGLERCKYEWNQINRLMDNDEDHSYEKCIILVATKLDLLYNTVDHNSKNEDIELMKKNQEEGIKLSKTWNVPYIETSAKENVNIQLLFKRAVYEYWIQSQGHTIKWTIDS